MQTSREEKVNASVILQSINGYLLLGLAFSLVVAIVLKYNSNAFFFPEFYDANQSLLDESQYISLVTISTLGYGDIIPVSAVARSLTTSIAISGQLYLAIIIALLVSKLSSFKR